MRDEQAKIVTRLGVGGFQVGLLAPGRAGAGEDIRRPGALAALFALVSVHAGGIAGFPIRPDHQRVAGDGDGTTKAIKRPGVGGFQVGLLAPGRAAAGEDIGRPGIAGILFPLVSVHTGVIAGFPGAPTTTVSPEIDTPYQNSPSHRYWRLSGRPAGSRPCRCG